MNQQLATGYSSTYELFDSALMRKIRAEAYDRDIGQHSWLTVAELESYTSWLQLSSESIFLDFGCGPGGPLCFLCQGSGARAVGVDLSEQALEVAGARAKECGVENAISLIVADGNDELLFAEEHFDAIVSFDVVLHLQKRDVFFDQAFRVLKPTGKMVFTDAGVMTGPVSNIEISSRSINGYTQFVPVSYNLELLRGSGFEIVEVQDQTRGAISNATGRLAAYGKYRSELIEVEGVDRVERQCRYLECVAELYERSALSRFAYFAIKNV